MEVEIVELSLSGSVSLERTNDIDCAMKHSIFFSKLEVFSNFLSFSQKSRFIVFVSLAEPMNVVDFDSFFLDRGWLRRKSRLNKVILFDVWFADHW